MSLTIQLDPATAEAVQELAYEQQRSADEVVRDALSAYVRSAKRAFGETGVRRNGRFRKGSASITAVTAMFRRRLAKSCMTRPGTNHAYVGTD